MNLTSEEKFAFLQLTQYIAKLDGEYGVKERELIEEYCTEMGIENFDIDTNHFIIEECLKIFKTVKSQKIALLAIMVLVHIDDAFGLYEHKVIHQISQIFSLDEQELHFFSMWGKAGSALYEQALLLTQK